MTSRLDQEDIGVLVFRGRLEDSHATAAVLDPADLQDAGAKAGFDTGKLQPVQGVPADEWQEP